MSTEDFLVEIGTEELPPLALKDLGSALCDGVLKGIDAAGLQHGAALYFATPRRLAVLVKRLAVRQLDRQVERRGPPVNAAFDESGQPTAAGLAFAKSCGVAVAALEKIDTPKGAWLVYRGTESGADTVGLLPAIVRQAIAALPIPKRMRWGAHSAEFVRPVHGFVMLMGEAVIDCVEFELRAGRVTRGHRFHAPRPINLRHAKSYAGALKRGKVIADFEQQRATKHRTSRAHRP
jgi:glycyl-tRNA synthetase beta chain